MYLDWIQAKIPLTTIVHLSISLFATPTFLTTQSWCHLDHIKPVLDNQFSINCGRAFPTTWNYRETNIAEAIEHNNKLAKSILLLQICYLFTHSFSNLLLWENKLCSDKLRMLKNQYVKPIRVIDGIMFY